MICDPAIFVERLKSGDRISVADELTIEHIIRNRCEDMQELESEYNKYCIRKDQRSKDSKDPSSQEVDRTSWKR